jgi:hypothetical protein
MLSNGGVREDIEMDLSRRKHPFSSNTTILIFAELIKAVELSFVFTNGSLIKPLARSAISRSDGSGLFDDQSVVIHLTFRSTECDDTMYTGKKGMSSRLEERHSLTTSTMKISD